ncbi:hypothetical protein D3C75_1202400 [compost metagenome]
MAFKLAVTDSRGKTSHLLRRFRILLESKLRQSKPPILVAHMGVDMADRLGNNGFFEYDFGAKLGL